MTVPTTDFATTDEYGDLHEYDVVEPVRNGVLMSHSIYHHKYATSSHRYYIVDPDGYIGLSANRDDFKGWYTMMDADDAVIARYLEPDVVVDALRDEWKKFHADNYEGID